MCGISGVVSLKKESIKIDEVKILHEQIPHRGPDGEGFYAHSYFALAHRRLSIIDTREISNQPLFYDQNVIVFNGEIFNYIEIKLELIALGYAFKTDSDTEVILAAYAEWGEACVKKFNGMWAFCIYDFHKNILFCSRDRFGIKPFYYTIQNDKLYFGSEIKQLLHTLNDRKANYQIIGDFLLGFLNHTEQTFFEDILQLLPAHNLFIDLEKGTIKFEKYYELKVNQEVRALDETQSLALFEEKFENSINLRLRSDVKVGTCLSGGLDSSLIASIASKKYKSQSGEKFIAITTQSVDPKNDESRYAKMVSDYCDLDWKVSTPNIVDFQENIDKLTYIQEEPFGGMSLLMQYSVMKQAKDNGCIVLLDGQGGDELLLGYERYFISYLKLKKGFFNKIRTAFQLINNSKLSWLDFIKYYFYFNSFSIRQLLLKKRFSFLNREFREFINFDLIKRITSLYKDNLDEMQIGEIMEWQLRGLLNFEDKNSMAHSIEARLPFLDFELVEVGLSINPEFRIKEGWSKYMIRALAAKNQYLPDEITWRKDKIGFEAAKNYFNVDNDGLIEIINNSTICQKMFNIKDITSLEEQIFWKIFSIANWERIYQVKA